MAFKPSPSKQQQNGLTSKGEYKVSCGHTVKLDFEPKDDYVCKDCYINHMREREDAMINIGEKYLKSKKIAIESDGSEKQQIWVAKIKCQSIGELLDVGIDDIEIIKLVAKAKNAKAIIEGRNQFVGIVIGIAEAAK